MSTLEGGAWQAAGGYLEHLSDADLALLGSAAGSLPAERLRGDPAIVERLLDDPRTFQAVFGGTGRADPLLRASPFLVFALAIQRGAEDLREAAFVGEWAGPRQRLPVFDVATLRDFLAAPARRLFLAELLASYVHVASGSVLVQTRRGWRRQRFSELDPVRLAALLDVVPAGERVGIYRRLGDRRRRAAGAARPALVPARLPERAGAHRPAAGDGRGGRALRPGEADPQPGHRHLPLPIPRPLVPRPRLRRLETGRGARGKQARQARLQRGAQGHWGAALAGSGSEQVVEGGLLLAFGFGEGVLERGPAGLPAQRVGERVLAAEVLAGVEQVVERGALLALQPQADGGQRGRLPGGEAVLGMKLRERQLGPL